MKVGDVVIHKLTNEKVLIISEYWEYSRTKMEDVRTGFECRLQNYDNKVFYDSELTQQEKSQ